jgi:hypothetical protein
VGRNITLSLLKNKNKNNSKNHANSWKLNSTLLNDQWVIDEIPEEIKSFLEVNENENMIYQTQQRQS